MLISHRPRRLRRTRAIRRLVQESQLSPFDLIAPFFVTEKAGAKEPLASLPGQFRLGPDLLVKNAEAAHRRGLQALCLFPVCGASEKDPYGRAGADPQHFYQRVIQELKARCPDLLVMTDVALDPYSSDGHDGYVNPKTGEIENDTTLELLVEMALTQAASGADILGPSEMMDGRIQIIREALEEAGHSQVAIMSYTAKYASAFYGPFRQALDSAPGQGDKKTYQMDPANGREALREALLDESEGADILMVKPGLPYLDVLYRLREVTTLPLAAYHVSGEYAMVKAASEKGWIDHDGVLLESLLAFKRAGAQMILTYFALEALDHLT